jgi:hypothetical protein
MMWRRSLLAVGIVLLAAILLQPLWLAPLVGYRLTQSAGRPVLFDRMWLSLSSSLQPVVQWRGIRIDNAPWADSRRPFAALASATAVISWRSIEQRRPVIELEWRTAVGLAETYDAVRIRGAPPIDLVIHSGIHGDQAAATLVTHAIPAVGDLRPGLRTVLDLPVLRYQAWPGLHG